MCIFGHKYEAISAQPTIVMGGHYMGQLPVEIAVRVMDRTKYIYPVKTFTLVLMRCRKCMKVKAKTVPGLWTLAEVLREGIPPRPRRA